jgi:hypothetical protein
LSDVISDTGMFLGADQTGIHTQGLLMADLTRQNASCPDCEECRRLWSEYSTNTKYHIGLNSKLRLAVLEHDRERIEMLTSQVGRAGQARIAAGAAYHQHKAEAHLQQPTEEAGDGGNRLGLWDNQPTSD